MRVNDPMWCYVSWIIGLQSLELLVMGHFCVTGLPGNTVSLINRNEPILYMCNTPIMHGNLYYAPLSPLPICITCSSPVLHNWLVYAWQWMVRHYWQIVVGRVMVVLLVSLYIKRKRKRRKVKWWGQKISSENFPICNWQWMNAWIMLSLHESCQKACSWKCALLCRYIPIRD